MRPPLALRPRWTVPILGVLCTAALLFSVAVLADGGQRVTRIVDGDTLVVEGLGTVRLIGVDTPETVDPRKPVQAYGAEASAFLTRLAAGKVVRAEYDVNRTDRYGRTLAYLFLEDGTFINAEIVRQGYGHAYLEFPFNRAESFVNLEREAREAGRGLWRENPQADKQADPIVVITMTGDRYHRESCRTLKQSRYEVPLSEAKRRGLTACGVCNPPQGDTLPR